MRLRLAKISKLDLARVAKTKLSHVVPHKRVLSGGFIGGFAKGCSVKVLENQQLAARLALQVQNIE
jgi:hypothetical protein